MTDRLQCEPADDVMVRAPQLDAAPITFRITDSRRIGERIAALADGLGSCDHPGRDLRWLLILEESLRHRPWLIEALRGGRTVGYLPLAHVSSALFGRYLVSLPYVNSGGVVCADAAVGLRLIEQAVALTDRLDCRFLELRHEAAWAHSAFNAEMDEKVHMRLALPRSAADLWDGLKSKVRSQVRKGRRNEFQIRWGGAELLSDFYGLFSRRMRDLGTPVYSRRLFAGILRHFDGEAEFCCLYDGRMPVASALLIHGGAVSEVPSASSLVDYNSTNVNMLLYWHLLERAADRGQQVFDFGRSTRGGNTYRFKKQWGAELEPAVWQYYVRHGTAAALRPESSRNQRLIRLWKKLPVCVTRWVGPAIVRGIP